MTRLVGEDIAHITDNWPAYEAELTRCAGFGLWPLALAAAAPPPDRAGPGPDAEKPPRRSDRFGQVNLMEGTWRFLGNLPTVGVISIGVGDGFIPGFGLALKSIAAHLGFPAFLAERTDLPGWAEALERGARVVLCSDDDFFAAFNLDTGRVAENSRATGRIYAELLSRLAGGLAGRPAHVTGAGPVGRAGALRLAELGAEVLIHDPDVQAAEALAAALAGAGRAAGPEELAAAQKSGGLFLQAAPDPQALDWSLLNPASSLVVHPAVPLGLPQSKRAAWRGRFWHDPLELGTAAMLAEAVAMPS